MAQDEDVVRVTIDRRSKSIQDYSGSAEAFSEADLERKNVTSLRQLTAATPFIEVGAQEGNLEVYMRGIGNANNTEIGDPAAAFHLDGIYIPRPRGTGTMFFDIERVEVARGPQGTLRGRNATAGSMNIVTAAPKLGEWGASGTFQIGNYMQRLTKAMVNIPIGDRLALRFATFTERRDPFYKNEGGNPNIRAAEDADTFAYRASLKWSPTDNISVTLRHDSVFERGTGWVGTNVTEALTNGILPEEIPDVRSVGYVGHQPSQYLDHWGVSGQIDLNFGPVNAELVSSYRKLLYKQTTGTTGGVNYYGKAPIDLDRYSSSYWRTESESVVNELRFFAPNDAAFNWTVGGFHLFESQYVLLGEANDKSWGWAGQEYNHPDIENGAYAGYADATVAIMDGLRGIGGVRVTHDWKHRNGVGWGYPVGCAKNDAGEKVNPDCVERQHRFGTEGFQFAGPGRSDYTSGPDARADFLDGIANFGARDDLWELYAQDGAALPTMTEQRGKTDDTFFDFRVGAEIDATADNLLYATFSTGHKSGGFNDTVTVNGEELAPTFEPESVYATEIGSKNEFLDRALTLNAAAFWYAYKDYQAQTVQNLGAGDGENAFRTSLRQNVGDARILGLEIDATARLPEGFTVRGAAMLLDARFLGVTVNDTRISWDPSQQIPVSLEGNFLPRAPRFGISYGIEQTIQTSIGYFDWSLSGQTKSEMYMTYFNGDGVDTLGNVNPLLSDKVPWTHRFDASVGYTRPEGDIRIEGFASNFTDMTYMTSLINAPGLNLRFYNPPRQFGARLSLYL